MPEKDLTAIAATLQQLLIKQRGYRPVFALFVSNAPANGNLEFITNVKDPDRLREAIRSIVEDKDWKQENLRVN